MGKKRKRNDDNKDKDKYPYLELQNIVNKIEDRLERLKVFEDAYYNGIILERNTEEEFLELRKDMFMEEIAPLLFEKMMYLKSMSDFEE